MNVSQGDLNNLHGRDTLYLTEGEFCIILHRIITSEDSEDGMGDILGDAFPYRSKTWGEKIVNKIDRKMASYVCHDTFDDLVSILKKVFDIVDTYEVLMLNK